MNGKRGVLSRIRARRRRKVSRIVKKNEEKEWSEDDGTNSKNYPTVNHDGDD